MADSYGYARTIVDELADLERGVLDGEQHETPWTAVYAWAETCALDVEYTKSIGAKSITGVSILRTFGGPNAWIDAHGDGTVTVRVAWWGERSEVTTSAPTVDGWAWEVIAWEEGANV